jgi:hypothetical protein
MRKFGTPRILVLTASSILPDPRATRLRANDASWAETHGVAASQPLLHGLLGLGTVEAAADPRHAFSTSFRAFAVKRGHCRSVQ